MVIYKIIKQKCIQLDFKGYWKILVQLIEAILLGPVCVTATDIAG